MRDRLQIELTRICLLIVIVGTALAGNRLDVWPIATWPMYSHRLHLLPESSYSAVQLRVTLRDGTLVSLGMDDFYPAGNSKIPTKLVETAFSSPERDRRDRYRKAVLAMVSRALGGRPVASIEASRVVWAVDPFALPPLERNAPSERKVLGRLDFSSEAETPR